MFRFVGLAALGLIVTAELLLFIASLQTTNFNDRDAVRYGLKFVFWLVVLVAAFLETRCKGVEDEDADYDGP